MISADTWDACCNPSVQDVTASITLSWLRLGCRPIPRQLALRIRWTKWHWHKLLPEGFPCSSVNYHSTCHLCLFIIRRRYSEPLRGRTSSYWNYFTPLSEKVKKYKDLSQCGWNGANICWIFSYHPQCKRCAFYSNFGVLWQTCLGLWKENHIIHAFCSKGIVFK